MLFFQSLRLRLLALILIPLLLVASLAIGWQYKQSTLSAETVFDQKLSIMALAIFRDLLATGGESLSPATKMLFEEAAGAPFFYHVQGPDGSFVTGYSPPPLKPKSMVTEPKELIFFDSIHRGRAVEVVQISEQAVVDELTGTVIVSVWQDLEQRTEFAHRLAWRGAIVAILLVITASLVVFFGVRLGLRPLKSLEEAISQRSGSDLRPIKREVPNEVTHIVQRLNELFDEVTKSQSKQERFISNAAHQLRNPIAGIHSLAEVVKSSRTLKEAKRRNAELVEASSQLSYLTEQLLSYESLKRTLKRQPFSVDPTVRDIISRQAPLMISNGLNFSFKAGCGDAIVNGDKFLLEQALINIIDNSIRHGGNELSRIEFLTGCHRDRIEITVCNNGKVITNDISERVFERFEQGTEGSGSGLGLAIVREICMLHDGDAKHHEIGGMVCFTITLPHGQNHQVNAV